MAPRLEQQTILSALLLLLFLLGIDAAVRFQSYQQACHESAENPEFCVTMLSSAGLEGTDVGRGSPGRFQLVSTAMKLAFDGVMEEIRMTQALGGGAAGTEAMVFKSQRKEALNDCVEMLTDASELIAASQNSKLPNSSSSTITDVHTWMSAALSYQASCLDGLDQVPPGKDAVDTMRLEGGKVGRRISTVLSFITTLLEVENEELINNNNVSWVPELLTKPKPKKKAVSANVVVAQDGSGNYKSIQAAVEGAPSKSSSAYVIYIKSGTYKEKVSVPKSKTNLMFIGDGMGKTVISGSKNVQDGVTTFKTATVEISGRGFMGRDLTIENTAGPAKHQAVALRVSADKVAFYKCSLEGFQDTLYTHVLRQFYRECNVYGTVDFIFGDAAAVFQSCSITARQPLSKQKNTVTAQGRTDPNQNTGLSFQDCTIDGKSGVPTYLGRPWKKYSRTVFLRCYEGSVIHPAGWLEWSGSFALKTLFYGEYACKGPGSGSGSRVGWSTQISSGSVAAQFTPGSFISGGDWLGGTGFPYSLGL